MTRLALVLALMTSVLATSAAPPESAAAQCGTGAGSVVQLSGTPHLFIMDQQGILHWGGDTRGLAGKYVNWSDRCNVGLDTLSAMRRGDPWLSSGLPKIGDPIYLSKWEDNEAAPTLLHIQSIPDVELFGIGYNNYGNFVLDRGIWEQRYGFDVGSLKVGPLPAAASFAWPASVQSDYARLMVDLKDLESSTLVRIKQAGLDGGAYLPSLADCERSGLSEFDRSRDESRAVAASRSCASAIDIRTTPMASVPMPPTNVRVIPVGAGYLRIEWNDTADERGFRVYAGDPNMMAATPVAATSENITVAEVPIPAPGMAQCFSVAAFNEAGESQRAVVCPGTGGQYQPSGQYPPSLYPPLGAGVGAPYAPSLPGGGIYPPIGIIGGAGMPTAPSQLQSLSVPGSNTVLLRWSDASGNETGFRILRNGQQIASVPLDWTTFMDTTATRAVPSCYQVIAFNALGEAPSNLACLPPA